MNTPYPLYYITNYLHVWFTSRAQINMQSKSLPEPLWLVDLLGQIVSGDLCLFLYHGRPHNVHCFLWLAILLVLHVIWTIPPSCERSSIELSCISSKISFTSPSYCMAVLLHAMRIGGYVRAMQNFQIFPPWIT